MDDEIKKAEARGYQKGYVAGRARKKRQAYEDAIERRRARFHNQALLAALPACISSQGWVMNGKDVRDMEQRVELAKRAADCALKHHWREV